MCPILIFLSTSPPNLFSLLSFHGTQIHSRQKPVILQSLPFPNMSLPSSLTASLIRPLISTPIGLTPLVQTFTLHYCHRAPRAQPENWCQSCIYIYTYICTYIERYTHSWKCVWWKSCLPFHNLNLHWHWLQDTRIQSTQHSQTPYPLPVLLSTARINQVPVHFEHTVHSGWNILLTIFPPELSWQPHSTSSNPQLSVPLPFPQPPNQIWSGLGGLQILYTVWQRRAEKWQHGTLIRPTETVFESGWNLGSFLLTDTDVAAYMSSLNLIITYLFK